MGLSIASGGARRIDAGQLQVQLADGAEIAVLDVRELGAFTRKHLLLAVNAPLWRLELLIDALVPRRDTRIVLTDLDESLAPDAAEKLARLGYTNLSVLAGGTLDWEQSGRQVYTGSNVPSKAFGELIEHQLGTPHIDADELDAKLKRGENLVVVDSRTPEEFHNFSLPGAHSLPGAELVYRIAELAPDPETLVVVNCAGRTRSILGAQTLINAGIPNRVVSLKDGTMAWLLSGRQLEHGRSYPLPEPSPRHLDAARERAARVASAAGVRTITTGELADFAADARRTLYRFDVRTLAEYRAGHLPGWRWAPGGQLVQATDEYAGTRRARIVLADWDGVRARTTAAWLAQLGGHDVYLYTPPAGASVETGDELRRVLRTEDPQAPWIEPPAAARLLREGRGVIFDVDDSLAFARRQIRGARFAVADRIHEFIDDLPTGVQIVFTSEDGVLARAVASNFAQAHDRPTRALLGGNQGWVASGLPTESGRDAILTGDDDAWYSPYAYQDEAERNRHFRDYLQWELDLVGQLQREGDIGVRLVRPSGA